MPSVDVACAEMLDKMMWPHNVIAMETLVAALECAFHGLLDDQIRDLVD